MRLPDESREVGIVRYCHAQLAATLLNVKVEQATVCFVENEPLESTLRRHSVAKWGGVGYPGGDLLGFAQYLNTTRN